MKNRMVKGIDLAKSEGYHLRGLLSTLNFHRRYDKGGAFGEFIGHLGSLPEIYFGQYTLVTKNIIA